MPPCKENYGVRSLILNSRFQNQRPDPDKPAEQSKDVEEKYYRPKPSEFFEVGGLSYYSCSS